MDDVREDFLGPSHNTTPAAVIANKIKLRSLKSREDINEKGDGPYRSFGYLSLFSDLEIWQHGAKENYSKFTCFNRVVDT